MNETFEEPSSVEGGSFIDTVDLKKLIAPWNESPLHDSSKHSVIPSLEFLYQMDSTDIQTCLGQILKDLSTATPIMSNILVEQTEETATCIRKLNSLLGKLLGQENQLLRGKIVACEALLEVMKSGNKACTIFLEQSENSPSVLSLIVEFFKYYRDIDLLTVAQLCILSLVSNQNTWREANEAIAAEGEDGESFLDNLRVTCYNEANPLPTVLIERMVLLTCWIAFCQASLELKDTYDRFSEEDGESFILSELIEHWKYFAASYDELRNVFRTIPLDDCFQTWSVYPILEQCDILKIINTFLLLNVSEVERCMSPPFPIDFLQKILDEENGLLYIVTSSDVYNILETLTQIAQIESEETSLIIYFHHSLRDIPLAEDVFTSIMNGFRIIKFCDKMLKFKNSPHHIGEDDFLVDFISSLHSLSLRRDYSKFMAQKYLNVLLDVRAREGRTSVMNLVLHLLETAAEEATDPTLWVNHYHKLFVSLRRCHYKDIKGIEHDPSFTFSIFLSKISLTESKENTINEIFRLASHRLQSTSLSKSHVTCIHIIEAMMLTDRGRYKPQVMHEMVGSQLEKQIKLIISGALSTALPLFQAGMPSSSPENELLLRFAIPAIRILGHLVDTTGYKEAPLICSGHIENLLGLWTLTLDLNGQSPCSLADKLKTEIARFFISRSYRVLDNKTFFIWLISYGSSNPIYFAALLEIFLAILPEELPLLIIKDDIDEINEKLQLHAIEVDRWRIQLARTEDIPLFGEVLLCSNPYVLSAAKEFVRRTSTMNNEVLIENIAWNMWRYIVNSLKDTVKEAEKSTKESEVHQLAASSAQSRILSTFVEMLWFPGMPSALTRNLTTEEGKSASEIIMNLFHEASINNKYQESFQSSLVDVICAIFTNESSYRLLFEKEGSVSYFGKNYIQGMLNVVLMKNQSINTVNKIFKVLTELFDSSIIAKCWIEYLLPSSKLYTIFSHYLNDLTSSLGASVVCAVRLAYKISTKDDHLKKLLFDPIVDNEEQALVKVVPIMASSGTTEEDLTLMKEVLKLATEAKTVNQDRKDLNEIAKMPECGFTEEFYNNLIRYRVLDCTFDVQRHRRLRFGKVDARQSAVIQLEEDLAQIILDSLGSSNQPDISQSIISNFQKSEKLLPPDSVHWNL